MKVSDDERSGVVAETLFNVGGATTIIPEPSKESSLPCKVLLLTTYPPETIVAEWPPYQNWFLPELIQSYGADMTIGSWRDAPLDAASASTYDKISFLWCNDYHEHPIDFPNFIRGVLLPAQHLNPHLHIFNDPAIILWNIDKHYLHDLTSAGFRVPRTTFLDVSQLSRRALLSRIAEWKNTAVVLKPAISGSARNTHLIKKPQMLTVENHAFIERVLIDGTHGDLIVQEYEPGITAGEYSLMFIEGKHTHTVLKVPQRGEFRINGEFGGRAREISGVEVPKQAVEAAEKVVRWLQEKFPTRRETTTTTSTPQGADEEKVVEDEMSKLVYTRIDGVMHGDTFVLMEVEAIEPHMWLEKKTGTAAMEALKKVFMARGCRESKISVEK